MPEILRNLTIAEILWHLGILIWLGRFRLAFCKGICNNMVVFRECIYLTRFGSLLRAFSVALKFSQTSIFYLLVFADK